MWHNDSIHFEVIYMCIDSRLGPEVEYVSIFCSSVKCVYFSIPTHKVLLRYTQYGHFTDIDVLKHPTGLCLRDNTFKTLIQPCGLEL